MFMMFPKASFTSKCVHFIWLQLQHGIKYWNYVLEFQFSQNITFENTRKVTISIELIVEIFKAQTLAMVLDSAQGHLSLWILEENECILWKTWTLWSSLHIQNTLPSRIFCMNAVVLACLYAVSNWESICSYKQREQATEISVKQIISLWIQENNQISRSKSQCKKSLNVMKPWTLQNTWKSL